MFCFFILSFYTCSLVSLIFKEWSDFQGGYCYCFMFMILICMPFVFHRLTTNPCAQTNGVSDPTVAGTSSGSRVSYFPRLCDFNLLCESLLSIRECTSLQPAIVRHWTKPLRHRTARGRFCMKATCMAMSVKLIQSNQRVTCPATFILFYAWIRYDQDEELKQKKARTMSTWIFCDNLF